MKTAEKTDTAYFTAKGQVLIPRRLRKELDIEEGTRVLVLRENDHLVLKPLTAKRYDALQGCLKGKGVLEALMEDRRQEREL